MVEELAETIDLVVMPGIGEAGHLAKEGVKPVG